MSQRTWNDILETAMAATNGIVAILAIAIFFSPDSMGDIVITGTLILVILLVYEWYLRREAPPQREEDEN